MKKIEIKPYIYIDELNNCYFLAKEEVPHIAVTTVGTFQPEDSRIFSNRGRYKYKTPQGCTKLKISAIGASVAPEFNSKRPDSAETKIMLEDKVLLQTKDWNKQNWSARITRMYPIERSTISQRNISAKNTETYKTSLSFYSPSNKHSEHSELSLFEMYGNGLRPYCWDMDMWDKVEVGIGFAYRIENNRLVSTAGAFCNNAKNNLYNINQKAVPHRTDSSIRNTVKIGLNVGEKTFGSCVTSINAEGARWHGSSFSATIFKEGTKNYTGNVYNPGDRRRVGSSTCKLYMGLSESVDDVIDVKENTEYIIEIGACPDVERGTTIHSSGIANVTVADTEAFDGCMVITPFIE